MPTQDLLTRFRADTRDFDRGTRRINGQLRRLERTTDRRMSSIERRMVRAGRAVTAAFAGLATIRGFQQLSRSVQDAASTLDNIAKQADKLGVTTDALQELRVAAELSGVSVQTFDLAFQRFVRRSSEAAKGAGEAKDVLKELGITFEELNTLSPDELFTRVAESMSKTERQSDLLRQGFKLFDSEGVQVVEMLRNGAAGLEELRRRAREAGLVFEEELIRETVRLKDEMTLLERQLSVDTTRALISLGPLLRDLGGLMVWLADRAAEAREGFANLFSGQLFDSISDVIALSSDIPAQIEEARAQLDALPDELAKELDPGTRSVELQLRVELASEEAARQGETFDEVNFILEEFVRRREGLTETVERLQQRLGDALSGTGEDVDTGAPVEPPPSVPPRPLSKGQKTFKREIEQLKERTRELQRLTAAQSRLNPELETYQTSLRAAEVEAGLLASAEANNIQVTEKLAAEIRSLAQAYADAEAAADTLERTNALRSEVEGLAQRAATLQRVTAAQARLDPTMENYAIALRAAEIEARLLARAEAEGVKVKGDLAQRIREVAQAYAEAEGAADRFRERREEAEEDESLKNLADGLGAVISQAETFEDALEGVIRKLAEVALQAALLSAFTGGNTPEGKGNALSGFFDNIFGSVFHKGGVVGGPAPVRELPAATWLGAPRLHDGGAIGLRPNEVPAILERGEIVVPKNIGAARGGSTFQITEGDINVTQPGASVEEIRRMVREERAETIRELIRMNDRDPTLLHT